jgi:hypothetical protein
MKKLKEKMLILGLKPKREFLIVLITDLVLIIAAALTFIFLKQVMYLATFSGVAFVFDLLFLTRYSKQISNKNTENLQEFAVLFGYFRIYIHNGFSVYSGLKELLNFANPTLKKDLQELISDIDSDKSVQPFIKFGRKFNEIIVEEMMISIYQMIDDGENSDYLVQFELIFDKFSDLLYEKYLRAKNSKLATLSNAPLIGASFLVIVLTIGVISILGEVINGI